MTQAGKAEHSARRRFPQQPLQDPGPGRVGPGGSGFDSESRIVTSDHRDRGRRRRRRTRQSASAPPSWGTQGRAALNGLGRCGRRRPGRRRRRRIGEPRVGRAQCAAPTSRVSGCGCRHHVLDVTRLEGATRAVARGRHQHLEAARPSAAANLKTGPPPPTSPSPWPGLPSQLVAAGSTVTVPGS